MQIHYALNVTNISACTRHKLGGHLPQVEQALHRQCKIKDMLQWQRKDESSALPDDLDYPVSRNGPCISYQFIVNFLHSAPEWSSVHSLHNYEKGAGYITPFNDEALRLNGPRFKPRESTNNWTRHGSDIFSSQAVKDEVAPTDLSVRTSKVPCQFPVQQCPFD